MLSAQNFLFAAILLVITLIVSLVNAAVGGDVSQLFSVDAYRCARESEGWSFGITRGWCSFGGLDPNGLANLDNMKAGGLLYHDMYFFPCKGKSAQSQVEEAVNHYAAYLRHGSMMWFDIETNPSPGCAWQSQAENCAYIGELIDAARGMGINTGVYSSPYEWETVAGSGCHIGAEKGQQLWWADYNGQEDFSGFYSFGGWTKPAIHQWADNGAACGISYDKNWYP